MLEAEKLQIQIKKFESLVQNGNKQLENYQT
jgi:hypothetical protein